MTEFWNSLLTEKSWNLLTKLAREPFEFIVIGGWAAYLWTGLHKSKDIDIALADIKDLDYLKQNYDLKKNDRLRKYEISFGEIDLDIYAPYFSKLAMPVEDLPKHSAKVEGFNVVRPEALLILKQGAELARKGTVKGVKDQIDIVTLLCFSKVNWKLYFDMLQQYDIINYASRLRAIVSSFNDYSYLDLNPRQYKLKKMCILAQLRKSD